LLEATAESHEIYSFSSSSSSSSSSSTTTTTTTTTISSSFNYHNYCVCLDVDISRKPRAVFKQIFYQFTVHKLQAVGFVLEFY
jgi:hypothetical protein